MSVSGLPLDVLLCPSHLYRLSMAAPVSRDGGFINPKVMLFSPRAGGSQSHTEFGDLSTPDEARNRWTLLIITPDELADIWLKSLQIAALNFAEKTSNKTQFVCCRH